MIARLRFTLARMTGNEATLATYSLPWQTLFDDLKGRSIALVGNARSLTETICGQSIDSADLIIRINGAPIPGATSHGTRTDWLAMSIPAAPDLIAERNPKRLVWMTPKHKRLPWSLASDHRFTLAPAAWNTALAARLGHRPSTGLMLIDLLSRSEARQYTLYGFDFFSSLSLSGRRTAAQVPHDFAAEGDYVKALAARDQRLTITRLEQEVTRSAQR
jgi:hypothetical protein